jgi:soluble lytic murein transglycosylase-like protein
MLKETKDIYGNLQCRGVSVVRYLLMIFAVMTGLAMVYAATVPAGRADADYHASLLHGDGAVHQATKQAVLRWMKENSAMPEQVLSKIYTTAVNSTDTDLVLAICLVESNFNPHAESYKGAIGLMGIMPTVWLEELRERGIVSGKEDLYSIPRNINSGIYVLERYQARTKNLKEALSRYSGGDPEYARRVFRVLGEIARTRRSGERRFLTGPESRGMTDTPGEPYVDM